jgi:hypothetical protein
MLVFFFSKKKKPAIRDKIGAGDPVKTVKMLEPGLFCQMGRKFVKDAGMLLRSKRYYHILGGNVNKMVRGSDNRPAVAAIDATWLICYVHPPKDVG